MGLIKAVTGAAGGVLADSWRDFFYCEALEKDVLAAKGQKRISSKGRSSNKHGEDNIITNGSIIAVNDGQCMIIVESGEIVEVCAEPGNFVYDTSTEPTIFYGGLSKGLKDSFKQFGRRITLGGDTGRDQRIYFFNTKEIVGNKYGTSSPVPFRIIDNNIGLDLDSSVRCNGEYSYKLTDPILFYKNVCGNVEDVYTRDKIDSQLKSELLTALQPTFAKISAEGVRYSEVPAHADDIADLLNEELSEDWGDLRGIEIVAFGVNSITIPEEDRTIIKDLQRAAVMRDKGMAAANIVAAQSDAMRAAASNEGGAVNAFMGLGMSGLAGGANASQLFSQAEAQAAAAPAPAPAPASAPAAPSGAGWMCPTCNIENTGNFCPKCGAKKPEQTHWFCPQCGNKNEGNFCTQCGTKKPE